MAEVEEGKAKKQSNKELEDVTGEVVRGVAPERAHRATKEARELWVD